MLYLLMFYLGGCVGVIPWAATYVEIGKQAVVIFLWPAILVVTIYLCIKDSHAH